MVFITANIFGQKKTPLNIKTIGLEQQLTSVNIRKIIYDKNGFLWLPTQDGLNKYDGKEIIQFNKNSLNKNHNLLGSDCFASSYSEADTLLYIVSSYEGLNIININTNDVVASISSKEICNSKENVWIRSVVDYGKFLIFGSDNRQLIFFEKATKKVIKTISLENSFGSGLWNIFIKDNIVGVVYQNNGIETYDAKTFALKSKFLYINNPLKEAVINQITLKENDIWFATNVGIFIKDFTTGLEKKVEDWLPNNGFMKNSPFVSTLHFNNSNLFIGTSTSFFKYDLNQKLYNELEVNEEDKKNYLRLANSVLLKGDNVWIGGAYGLAQLNSNYPAFSAIYKDDANNNIEHIYSIFSDNNTNVFVAADEGFYKVDVDKINIKQLLKEQSVYGFGEISDDEFIVSGTKDLFICKKDVLTKISSVYPEFLPIKKELFISIQKINDSIVMLGSQLGTGLFVWNKKKHTINRIHKKGTPQLKDVLINRVWNYKKDSSIIIAESAIETIDITTNKVFTLFTKDNLLPAKTDVFMDMCKQSDNFWIAGYGLGMIKLDRKFKVNKIISTKEGMCNLGIYRIFCIGDSLIIGTTNNGLCIYNVRTDKVLNYFKDDGLHSNAFEETSGYLKNDSIFIGGIKGFTIFSAKNYKSNTLAPKLYFNNISISIGNKNIDTTNLFINYLPIPNNTTQTKISFIGLNYQNPNRVQYWYKIIELQNEWISLGNQNFLDLIGISPGKYTLQVKAANEDGVECNPIQMTLHFLPKWYQTLLFKILVALLVTSILYTLYRFRIRQLTKIINVRQKISSNLHDDIGSTLSSINMYSQIAQLKPNDANYINTIQENTQEVLAKLDDIVWATNPKNDKIKSVIERMDNFARPLLQAKNIQFSFNHNDEIETYKISEATRQNLFLIFKEAINNVAKYAKCKNCTVDLSIHNKTIYCTITDDGIGFDATKPTERNGLINMQHRAEELKGKIEISTILNEGTTVKLQLPL